MKTHILCFLLISSCQLSDTGVRAEDIEIVADVVYGRKDGLAMTLDVLKPKKNSNGAGVLFIVSGGWRSRWSDPREAMAWHKPLLDAGFVVFRVQHGSSPRYIVPEIVEDVRRSVRYVRHHARRFGVDPNRLGVYGASAGGHLSLVLGTTGQPGLNKGSPVQHEPCRVAAVVAWCPPTDLREWVGNPSSSYWKSYPALRFEPSKAEAVSPALNATPDDAPALLIHGDQDKLVPIAHSKQLAVALKKHRVPVELLVLEGDKHAFGDIGRKRAMEATVAWFRKHLAKSGRP